MTNTSASITPRSHSNGRVQFAVRESASSADTGTRGLDFFPDVPQQNATHLALAQVVHDALAVRLFPLAHRLKPGVQLADGLVAELEQVGVKGRQMRIALSRAGHIASGLAAHRIGVVFMLDPNTLVEGRIEKSCDIAGRIDIGRSGLKRLIDHDSTGNFEICVPGQVSIGNNTDTGNDRIY